MRREEQVKMGDALQFIENCLWLKKESVSAALRQYCTVEASFISSVSKFCLPVCSSCLSAPLFVFNLTLT